MSADTTLPPPSPDAISPTGSTDLDAVLERVRGTLTAIQMACDDVRACLTHAREFRSAMAELRTRMLAIRRSFWDYEIAVDRIAMYSRAPEQAITATRTILRTTTNDLDKLIDRLPYLLMEIRL